MGTEEPVPLVGRKPTATTGKPVLTVAKLADWTGSMNKIAYPIQVIDAVRDVILNVLFRMLWVRNNNFIRMFSKLIVPAVTDEKLKTSFEDAAVSPAAWTSRITRCKAIASARSDFILMLPSSHAPCILTIPNSALT
jgi:hypothetical protein